MAGKDTLKMTMRILDHHGLSYEIKRTKHVKISVDYEGRNCVLVTGGTISDRRAILNFYHFVRRTLINLGVPFQEDSKALIHN